MAQPGPSRPVYCIEELATAARTKPDARARADLAGGPAKACRLEGFEQPIELFVA
jgi:hypothetical protein